MGVIIVYRKGDIVKQPMKKGSFVPKNVPGVGYGGVGWGMVGCGVVGWVDGGCGVGWGGGGGRVGVGVWLGGSCRGGVGWDGSCRGGVGHVGVGVGWVMKGWVQWAMKGCMSRCKFFKL